jgi:predicted nucleic acid-binding protein
MITAVDTSILLDLFTADATFGARSKDALRRCIREGRVVACEAVFAEVACAFPNREEAKGAMQELGVEFEPLDINAALLAGEAFRAYRARGGRRERVIADFLIGAHAQERSYRLLTRDRGFHRTYFADLDVLDPSDES